VLNIKNIFFLLFIVVGASNLTAQKTTVEGYLKEKGSNRPIMFAHVLFKGTNIGGTTDTAGYFNVSIENTQMIEDTVVFSSLGYNPNKTFITKGQHQKIEAFLSANFFQLDEFVIKPGENPSWKIMRGVIANKSKNNPENLDNYEYKEYSKLRFDLNHFTDKIKKNILLRPFDYIWENTRETDDGIKYLPILLVEKSIDHYVKSSPKDQKSIVIGTKKTGMAGRNLMKFIDDLAISPNIYNNYVVILDKNFPSPLNDNYKKNYQFYLTDSTTISGNKEYTIVFQPKHHRELGFNGEMKIDSGSYAVKEISLRFNIEANVNFVRSYFIKQQYNKVEGQHWMMTESNVLGDFTVLENVSDLTGFFGRKNSKFINHKINQPIDPNIFYGVEIKEFKDDYKNKDSLFWNEVRLSEFTEEDNQVHTMVKRIEEDPAFIFRKKLITTIISGYIPLKKIDIGNIYTFYSYNEIEKSRFKFSFRINPKLHFPIDFSSYAAYGMLDEKWKYGFETQLNIGKDLNKKFILGGNYKYDINQLGRSFSQIPLDHIITSLSQIGLNSSKNYVQDFNIHIEKMIAKGLVTRVNYFNNKMTPTSNKDFELLDDNFNISTTNRYRVSGVDFTFKFNYLYQSIRGSFYDRLDVANSFRKFPDIAVKYKYSDIENFKSDFDFQKIKVSIRQQIRTKKMGYFTYYADLGKTYGTVPYPYLDIPFGNQQILLDEFSFNLMDFLEYASDQYASIHLSQHFDGLIMDRIPVINKLKWRSFIFGKGYFSSISDKNNQGKYLFPEQLQGLNKPYYEVGFGFENIFKIAKIDFVWRIKDNPTKDTYYFIVKPSFKFSF
jgi:hypothetical protein